MARRHPHRFCKECGKAREQEPGRLLSATGLCYVCGVKRREENIRQLIDKQGDYFEHYVRRSYMAARRMKLRLEKAS